MKKGGHTHRLDIEDRMVIQACIAKGDGLGQIAARLKVHKSTVLREIARWSVRKQGADTPCSRRRLGVCNGCCKAPFCSLAKAYYDFRAICSERTVRRLVYAGLLSAKAHELRRYVRFSHPLPPRPRGPGVADISVLIGRTHDDFLERREARPGECLVQLDSVIGKASDRGAILTITFPKYGFQFGRIVGNGQPGDVVSPMRGIFRKLPPGLAEKAFAVVLTDNGTEFSWLDRIDAGEDGSQARSVFFATPYRTTDKAECERLHGLLRYCIPKGHSLDRLDQRQVDDEACSDINSYVRGSKGDRTPYDLLRRRFGKAFLDAIGIRRVPKKKVRLPVA